MVLISSVEIFCPGWRAWRANHTTFLVDIVSYVTSEGLRMIFMYFGLSFFDEV